MAAAAAGLGWEAVASRCPTGARDSSTPARLTCPDGVVTRVTGPDGSAGRGRVALGDGTAVVEMARASGLTLAGGRGGNDPVRATSRGTGELLVAAARQVGPGGTVVVGLGGSATTDGGLGAWEAVERGGWARTAHAVIGACDVDDHLRRRRRGVRARRRGPGPAEVVRADPAARAPGRRSGRRVTGVDVRAVPGAGAAGGLGGAWWCSAAGCGPATGWWRDLVGLVGALGGADRVVTGEGALDAGLVRRQGGGRGDRRRPCARAAGPGGGRSVHRRGGGRGGRPPAATVVSLIERFGRGHGRSAEPLACVGDGDRRVAGVPPPG